MAEPLLQQDDREFVPSDEQRALRAMVDDYVQRAWDDPRLRAVLEGGARDPADLRALGSDLAVLGLTVPEHLGGGGAGLAEAVVVAERLGRRLVPLPYASAVLSAEVLAAAGRDDLLASLLSGQQLVVVAASDERGRWLPEQPTVVVRQRGDDLLLDGTAAHVVDAPDAGALIVLAGNDLLVVDAAGPGVELVPITPLDLSRPQATVVLRSAPGVRLGSAGGGAALLRTGTDRALLCVAAEALGAAEHLLAVSTAYASTRIQFGRPIGSHQAVKHRLADLLVAVEQTRAVVEHAAWTADHGGDDPASTTSCARVLAAETLIEAAATAVQVHGGIGFTWEHVAHLYFKRAHSDAVLWGGLDPHRARFAALALG